MGSPVAMHRRTVLLSAALLATSSIGACSSSAGSGNPVADISCRSFLGESAPARTSTFKQASAEVHNSATDADTEASVGQLCEFNPTQLLGITIQQVTGGGAAAPGGTAITAAPLATEQLPHETIDDSAQLIVSNELAILDEAACTKNTALLAHVFADQFVANEYATAISRGTFGCPHSTVFKLSVTSRSAGQFVVTVGGTDFPSGSDTVRWTGTEWLVSRTPVTGQKT